MYLLLVTTQTNPVSPSVKYSNTFLNLRNKIFQFGELYFFYIFLNEFNTPKKSISSMIYFFNKKRFISFVAHIQVEGCIWWVTDLPSNLVSTSTEFIRVSTIRGSRVECENMINCLRSADSIQNLCKQIICCFFCLDNWYMMWICSENFDDSVL